VKQKIRTIGVLLLLALIVGTSHGQGKSTADWRVRRYDSAMKSIGKVVERTGDAEAKRLYTLAQKYSTPVEPIAAGVRVLRVPHSREIRLLAMPVTAADAKISEIFSDVLSGSSVAQYVPSLKAWLISPDQAGSSLEGVLALHELKHAYSVLNTKPGTAKAPTLSEDPLEKWKDEVESYSLGNRLLLKLGGKKYELRLKNAVEYMITQSNQQKARPGTLLIPPKGDFKTDDLFPDATTHGKKILRDLFRIHASLALIDKYFVGDKFAHKARYIRQIYRRMGRAD